MTCTKATCFKNFLTEGSAPSQAREHRSPNKQVIGVLCYTKKRGYARANQARSAANDRPDDKGSTSSERRCLAGCGRGEDNVGHTLYSIQNAELGLTHRAIVGDVFHRGRCLQKLPACETQMEASKHGR